MDLAALQTDVSNLQTAVAALANPSTRATAAATAQGIQNANKGVPLWPTPSNLTTTQAYQARVILSGN
jgi:hypothetical protein